MDTWISKESKEEEKIIDKKISGPNKSGNFTDSMSILIWSSITQARWKKNNKKNEDREEK